MNTTRLFFLTLFSFVILSLASCKDDSPAPVLHEPVEKSLSFAADGGTQQTHVTLEGATPELSSDQSWCTAKVTYSTNAGYHTIAVTVEANSEYDSRKAVVSISYGSSTMTVDVVQAAKEKAYEPSGDTFDLGLGWNLGNQFDAQNNGVANETCWGNPKCTSDLFVALKKAGFTSVRIPVTWMGHIGEAPEYKIDDAWMNRVAEVVDYAVNAGLKAIVNIHHDGADSKFWLNIINAANSEKDNEQIREQIAAVWKQIATKFNSVSNDALMFESFNEIHDGGWGWGSNRKDGGKQYKVLNGWNQLFVDVVRATGGNNATRYLGVPGYCTNIDLTVENFVMPVDPAGRVLVAVHYYDPATFALEDKYHQWGHTAASGKCDPNGGNENNVKAQFDKLKKCFTAKGIQVYLGEFGCVRRSDETDEAFRRYYLEYISKAARDYGFGAVVWDNGQKGTGQETSGMFDRTTGEFFHDDAKAAVEAMVRGYNTNDPSYTLDAVYNSAPSSK